jgi:hypothetical protein
VQKEANTTYVVQKENKMSSIFDRNPEYNSHDLQLFRALHEEEKRQILKDVRSGRLGSIRSNATSAIPLMAIAALGFLALS